VTIAPIRDVSVGTKSGNRRIEAGRNGNASILRSPSQRKGADGEAPGGGGSVNEDSSPRRGHSDKELVQQAVREQRKNAYDWARAFRTQDSERWEEERERQATQRAAVLSLSEVGVNIDVNKLQDEVDALKALGDLEEAVREHMVLVPARSSNFLQKRPKSSGKTPVKPPEKKPEVKSKHELKIHRGIASVELQGLSLARFLMNASPLCVELCRQSRLIWYFLLQPDDGGLQLTGTSVAVEPATHVKLDFGSRHWQTQRGHPGRPLLSLFVQVTSSRLQLPQASTS